MITDLTGWTWVGNSSVTIESGIDDIYSLNFVSNYEEYLKIRATNNTSLNAVSYGTSANGYLNKGGPNTGWGSWVINWSTGAYALTKNDAYRTIHITGGTDATNPELISWLQANGTLTYHYDTLSDLFTGIADSIRNKKGTSEQIVATDFPSEIDSIELPSASGEEF